MIHLTRAQRVAFKRVYMRILDAQKPSARPMRYRELRAKVQGYPGGDCVLVPFAGMWLGIEKDGYTHS
jgi:hypothetical protein